MRKCECGTEIMDDYAICPGCGKLILCMRKCECGADIQDDYAICPECGKVVNPDKLYDTIRDNNTRLSNKNVKLRKLVWVESVVIIASLVGYIVYLSMIDRAYDKSITPVVVSVTDYLHKIEGNYAAVKYVDGQMVDNIQTAKIHKEGDGYTVVVVTDYGLEHHNIVLNEAGHLYSPTLGNGILNHKESINQLIILFNKENTSWELTK